MNAVLKEFEPHLARLKHRASVRLESVKLRSVVDDRENREAVTIEESLGKWQPQDELQGDVNMRTLHALLKMIDEKGFERVRVCIVYQSPCSADCLSPVSQSPHQLKFHAAFERAAARVIYRDSWSTQRPLIMKKWGWKTCPGEVLIR